MLMATSKRRKRLVRWQSGGLYDKTEGLVAGDSRDGKRGLLLTGWLRTRSVVDKCWLDV